jgi:hypothetical protein
MVQVHQQMLKGLYESTEKCYRNREKAWYRMWPPSVTRAIDVRMRVYLRLFLGWHFLSVDRAASYTSMMT